MKNIVIAEDIRKLVQARKTILSRAGIRMFGAVFSDDILEIHKREKADLIIADQNMPGRCIDEVILSIRRDEHTRRVSVIMICSDSETAKDRCRASGANTFFVRPVQAEELAARAKEYLDIAARGSFRVLMNVSLTGNLRGYPFYAATQDISSTGVLIETDKTLEKGDSIQCSFFVNSSQVSVEGEVVRVAAGNDGRQRYGVRFSGLSRAAKAHISKFVSERMKA